MMTQGFTSLNDQMFDPLHIADGVYKYVRVLISLWLSKGILFLQDNPVANKATLKHQKLADLHFEFLKHPAYSPELAPSDYYLFPNLFIKPKTYHPPTYCAQIWIFFLFNDAVSLEIT
jgi:hypothetical protein